MATPMDPWAAAFGGVASIGTAALQKTPSSMQSTADLGGFDSSGWNVNIGSGTQTPSYNKTSASGPAAGLLSLLQNPVVMVGILVGIYLMAKK